MAIMALIRMKLSGVLLLGVLSLSPAARSQSDTGDESVPRAPEETAPASAIDAFFKELMSEALQVDHLLNEVIDKESADRVAEPLGRKLAYIAERLHTLESFPLNEERDAEALKTHMTTLTHASQNSLAIMQRLVEVNAYGSEALMAVFNRYKMDGTAVPNLKADDLPHTQLYSELVEAMDDSLLVLRKIQDEASAREALTTLQPLLNKIEHAHHMLAQLAPPTTDEQKEALRPARERLHMLTLEIKEEISRLQSAHCYQTEELDTILPRLLRPSAS